MTLRNYKRLTMLLLIVTVLALTLTGVTQALGRKAKSEPAAAKPQNAVNAYYTPKPASSQESSGDTEGKGLLVTVYRGGLGVFEPGKTLPVLTKKVEVYLLPEEDVELLKKGIPVKNLSEAKAVLEDYD